MTHSMRVASLVRPLTSLTASLWLLCGPHAGAAIAQGSAKPPAKSTATKPAAAKPAPAKAAKPAPAGVKAIDIAIQARGLEEQGNYAGALTQLKRLRGMQGPDADLELAIALDEARTGLADSAWARLYAPVLSAALEDTAGLQRRSEYPFQREGAWVNGTFDGWYWYVARARAELAIARRDWSEAVKMASRAAQARPLSGKEALLLALAASHAGDAELGEAAANWAAYLEPWLPEAHYLVGQWAWRHGRRAEARVAFESAAELDSSWRDPWLALSRLTLPGSRPDSLPVRFLTGARACGQLTSARRPKQEEYIQFDKTPALVFSPQSQPPDSLRRLLALRKPTNVFVQVLVSETGHALLLELPYVTEAQVPAAIVNHIQEQVGRWRFIPAVKFEKPQRSWASVQYTLQP